MLSKNHNQQSLFHSICQKWTRFNNIIDMTILYTDFPIAVSDITFSRVTVEYFPYLHYSIHLLVTERNNNDNGRLVIGETKANISASWTLCWYECCIELTTFYNMMARPTEQPLVTPFLNDKESVSFSNYSPDQSLRLSDWSKVSILWCPIFRMRWTKAS